MSRFDGNGPVAILAGSGELPRRLADGLRAAGAPHRILAFRGFADRALRARADAVVGLLDVARIVACLDAWRPAAVALAGGLRRPSAAAVLDAYAALKNRDELARILARGDDGLFRAVTEFLEGRGHRLVGVRDLAPELLAAPGVHGRVRPTAADERAIRVGLDLLRALGPFDVGQAVVVAGERAVAVEGPEGTDAVLARARALRGGRALRFGPFGGRAPAPDGVLVKAPKPGQDLRVDLPAIGPRTVVNAAAAGLRGVAVASGASVVLSREATVAAADRLGVFVLGVAAGEGA